MLIDLIEYVTTTLPRKERFTIARGSSDVAELLFVSLHSGGLSGTGCGAPSEVTKETLVTMKNSMPNLVRGLQGLDFRTPQDFADRLEKSLPGNPAVKAAMDMAFHDLAAQLAGQSLSAFLGATRDRMPTDMTIGIMGTPDAVQHAKAHVAQGFRALKVKIGTDPRSDLERVSAVRNAVGPGVEIRIDGNQGYTWAQALSFARAAKDLNIAFFEQPVPANDFEGMRTLRESSPIPIMADEMLLTPEDAKKLRWGNAAHAVNLKLMKHGGIAGAAAVNTICESAGYPAMVGCMGEPQLSIAAALHFALATKNVRWLDLDSHFNLAKDPTSGLEFKHGHLIAPSKPGIGIDVDFSEMA